MAAALGARRLQQPCCRSACSRSRDLQSGQQLELHPVWRLPRARSSSEPLITHSGKATALAGKPISALILGGSIEAGADLANGLDSYFAHVTDWLNTTFPPSEGRHTFHNGGRSSTGSPYFARWAVRVWPARARGVRVGVNPKTLCTKGQSPVL